MKNPRVTRSGPNSTKALTKRLSSYKNRLMSEDIRFMNELFRIISGALRLDTQKVRSYTAFLAEKLENAGDQGSADRLRKLLEETDHQLRPAGVAAARALPVDTDSRFPLIELSKVSLIDEPDVVLPATQWQVVNEFLSVAKSHAQLEAEGVTTSMSLLLFGPPGCGKSRLARYIARELGLDLCVARLDGIISSYLGSTAKNIRALFDFASRTPCVLFLDEFDAIAKLRGDKQELGELKRVVSSFIQNLDLLGAQSIVLAATNHEDLLDAAVWRRFSYRIQLGYPTAEERLTLWSQFLRTMDFKKEEMELLVDLSEGFSGADINEVCLRLQRRHITTGETPQLKDAFEALRNLATGEGEQRRFLARFTGDPPAKIAELLRRRNSRLYSHSVLAHLLGISKATAHRWVKKGMSVHV